MQSRDINVHIFQSTVEHWIAVARPFVGEVYFGVLAAFTTGVPGMFVQDGFSAEQTYEVLQAFGITNFTAAPTVYRSLRNADVRVPPGLKLRCASSAGEPLTPEVNEWAKPTLGTYH